MALAYSWQQLIERIERHINNDFPSSEVSLSNNEALLYINEAMSFSIVGQVWNSAKILGYMEMPEAYLVTFQLAALKQDTVTKNWYSTMPQPPLSLPLGYSVNRVWFANAQNGEGIDCAMIRQKELAGEKICLFSMALGVGLKMVRYGLLQAMVLHYLIKLHTFRCQVLVQYH